VTERILGHSIAKVDRNGVTLIGFRSIRCVSIQLVNPCDDWNCWNNVNCLSSAVIFRKQIWI